MTETRDPTGTTVRSLMESYEHGEINFPTLLEAMRAHTCLEGPERPKDWAEVWERAEEMPDDDPSGSTWPPISVSSPKRRTTSF